MLLNHWGLSIIIHHRNFVLVSKFIYNQCILKDLGLPCIKGTTNPDRPCPAFPGTLPPCHSKRPHFRNQSLSSTPGSIILVYANAVWRMAQYNVGSTLHSAPEARNGDQQCGRGQGKYWLCFPLFRVERFLQISLCIQEAVLISGTSSLAAIRFPRVQASML